jgi:hypothetical protein
MLAGAGLPGSKKLKKAKFGHKQFQKRPNPEKSKKAK